MARSATKAAGESDVTAAGEKTLDFDDVTLRGGKKHVTVKGRVADKGRALRRPIEHFPDIFSV